MSGLVRSAATSPLQKMLEEEDEEVLEAQGEL